jgi:hypothetical protein
MGILSSAVNLQGNKILAAVVEDAALRLSEMLNSSDSRTVVIYTMFDNNTAPGMTAQEPYPRKTAAMAGIMCRGGLWWQGMT